MDALPHRLSLELGTVALTAIVRAHEPDLAPPCDDLIQRSCTSAEGNQKSISMFPPPGCGHPKCWRHGKRDRWRAHFA